MQCGLNLHDNQYFFNNTGPLAKLNVSVNCAGHQDFQTVWRAAGSDARAELFEMPSNGSRSSNSSIWTRTSKTGSWASPESQRLPSAGASETFSSCRQRSA